MTKLTYIPDSSTPKIKSNKNFSFERILHEYKLRAGKLLLDWDTTNVLKYMHSFFGYNSLVGILSDKALKQQDLNIIDEKGRTIVHYLSQIEHGKLFLPFFLTNPKFKYIVGKDGETPFTLSIRFGLYENMNQILRFYNEKLSVDELIKAFTIVLNMYHMNSSGLYAKHILDLADYSGDTLDNDGEKIDCCDFLNNKLNNIFIEKINPVRFGIEYNDFIMLFKFIAVDLLCVILRTKYGVSLSNDEILSEGFVSNHENILKKIGNSSGGALLLRYALDGITAIIGTDMTKINEKAYHNMPYQHKRERISISEKTVLFILKSKFYGNENIVGLIDKILDTNDFNLKDDLGNGLFHLLVRNIDDFGIFDIMSSLKSIDKDMVNDAGDTFVDVLFRKYTYSQFVNICSVMGVNYKHYQNKFTGNNLLSLTLDDFDGGKLTSLLKDGVKTDVVNIKGYDFYRQVLSSLQSFYDQRTDKYIYMTRLFHYIHCIFYELLSVFMISFKDKVGVVNLINMIKKNNNLNLLDENGFTILHHFAMKDNKAGYFLASYIMQIGGDLNLIFDNRGVAETAFTIGLIYLNDSFTQAVIDYDPDSMNKKLGLQGDPAFFRIIDRLILDNMLNHTPDEDAVISFAKSIIMSNKINFDLTNDKNETFMIRLQYMIENYSLIISENNIKSKTDPNMIKLKRLKRMQKEISELLDAR